MTGDEIIALSQASTRSSSGRRKARVDPIPVARAKGVYFWTPDGKRFLDFNSQLMCVNIGHGDPRVVKAIQDQAAVLRLRQPVHGDRAARAAGREAGRDRARATSTSSSSPTAAPRPTRTRSRSRARSPAARRSWRATARITAARPAAIAAHRRSAPLDASRRCPASSTCSTRTTASQRGWDTADAGAAVPRRGHPARRAARRSPRSSSNRSPAPTASSCRRTATCRACARSATSYGILMIADEVMSGFGRTGEWFAVDHWNVVPDIITMAKGLTSAYVQLGAVGMRRGIADHFQDKVFPSGLTYNSHPLACAAALATHRRVSRRTASSSARADGHADARRCSPICRRATRRSAPSARSASSASSSSCESDRHA